MHARLNWMLNNDVLGRHDLARGLWQHAVTEYTTSCQNPPEATTRAAGFTDNASVNVLPGASPGELLAVTESVPGTMRVDAATLRTLGGVTYADGVKGELNTAHPTLQRDGSLINLVIGVSANRSEPYLATNQERKDSAVWASHFS